MCAQRFERAERARSMNGAMWRVVSRDSSVIFHLRKWNPLSVTVRAFSASTGLYGFPHLKTAKGFQSFVDEAIQRYSSYRIVFLTQLILLLLFKLILMHAWVSAFVLWYVWCIFSLIMHGIVCNSLYWLILHMYLINVHLLHCLTYKR